MKRLFVILFGLVLGWWSLEPAFCDSLSGGAATAGSAFGTTRVVTGTTDTATSADYYGFIAWRSTTGGTQTLPACASGNNGKWIGVIDEQGNATTANIHFTAPSSTLASNATIGVNNGGVILQCDGTAATWSTISSAGALSNRNPLSRSDLLTLTDAANITIPSCAGGYQLSLGASGHTLGGLPAGCSAANFLNSMLLEVTVPSGCPGAGCVLNFATGVGYTIPADQVSGCGGNCITLSAGPGCIDDIALIPIGAASVRVSDPTKCQTAVAIPPVTIASGQLFQAYGTNASVTSLSVNATGFTAGHTIAGFITWCYISGCSTSGTAQPTGITATGGTCSTIPGTAPGSTVASAVGYRCTGMAAGTVAVGVTFASGVNYLTLDAMELVNDHGAEGGAVGVGSSGTVQATTGTLTGNGELVVAAASNSATNVTGAVAPATYIATFGGAYQTTSGCAGCTVNIQFIGGTGTWSVPIFALKPQ